MNQRVKVKIRPSGTMLFPDTCVYCSSPAEERMIIRKRSGRITRTIEIPVCVDCNRELQRESAEEEKMRTFGRLGSIVGSLLILILLLLLLPDALTILWRILFAAFSSITVGVIIYLYFDRRRSQGARPEKIDIRSSASMSEFSWRATTFEFSNEAFAKRFEELNQRDLMES